MLDRKLLFCWRQQKTSLYNIICIINATDFIDPISKSSYKVLPRKQKLQPFNSPCNDDRPTKIYQLQKVTSSFLEQEKTYTFKEWYSKRPQTEKKLHINFMRNFLFHHGKFFVSFRFAEIFFKMLKFTIERSWSKKKNV